ncbi:hypothetical protein, partial [Escherichia coli]|uniref:hypothetical protein n=1 Tax=Escherichia coli TaxID=562 RepID=UPI0035E462C1
WQHETRHAYNAQGLANRCIPDCLPAVEWLTSGRGYLAGMTRAVTPLLGYTPAPPTLAPHRTFVHFQSPTRSTPRDPLPSRHRVLSDDAPPPPPAHPPPPPP